MPADAPLVFVGQVASGSDEPLVLSGQLTTAAHQSLELLGAVSRALMDSYHGPTTSLGFRVLLAGQWIPDEDLDGPVELQDKLHSPNQRAVFALKGASGSILRTLNTWTIVPVEVWSRQRALDGREIEKLEFRGSVVPGSTRQSTSPLSVSVRVEADSLTRFGEAILCGEVAPNSGLTRGEIVQSFASSAGVLALVPQSGAHARPVVASNESLRDFLKAIGEPAGWYWRMVPHGSGLALEAYTADLVTAPRPPDHVWTIDECDIVEVEAPSRPVSKVMVTGFEVVEPSGSGIEVETKKTLIHEIYEPARAVEEQRTDGTVVSISPGGPKAAFRLVVEIENEVHRRDGLEVAVITRERGYYNPKAARLRTRRGGEGLGPADGYHYTEAYIDEGGEYRLWSSERFVLRSERRVYHTYQDGNLVLSTTEDYRYFSRTAGVKTTGSSPSWVVNVSVGTDDRSYRTTVSSGSRRGIEEFGLAERHFVTYAYDPVTGAQLTETQTSFGYYSPRGTLDVQNHFLLFSGEAQEDIEANFIQIREVRKRQGLTEDGRVTSEVTTESGYKAIVKRDGAFDWGGNERSNRIAEIYRLIRSQVITYRRQVDGSIEKLTISTEAPPKTERLPADSVPLPRFQLSEWTTLRQQPFEVMLEDPDAAALWGPEEITISSDYVANREEAAALAERVRLRSRARLVRVRRPESSAQIGETVLIKDPYQGLLHRGLLVDRRRQRNPETGYGSADYVLEIET